jgi:hypothetical protein
VLITPRPLTAAEAQLVTHLLDVATLGESPYKKQLESLRVVRTCDCGCPTVNFRRVNEPILPGGGSRRLVDAYGRTPGGVEVGIILWEREGHLTGLEIYELGQAVVDLPTPQSVSLDPPG